MIKQIMEDVKYILEEGEGCHDWDHTLRVYNLALHIGKIEGADLEILGIAALLHDIGRPEENKQKHQICHAEIGTIMAEGLLQGYGLGQETIEKIKKCILCHRYSRGHNPETLEEKILYDADKLDSIGAIGIGRAFVYSGTYNARVHNPEIKTENVREHSREDTAYQHYHIKLKKIKDKLFTNEAKRIAKERDEFMKEFFERLNAECRGEI